MRSFCAFAAVLILAPLSADAVEYKTEFIPMRDGTKLATEVFYPSAPGKYSTIIVRTPYGRDFMPIEIAEVICDSLRFAFISQDTRGRYDSEGVDDVFLSDGWGENQDGYDTVEWIVNQSWSDERVGFFGASAFGITSYMAMGSLHPAIKAAHVGIAPWSFYDMVYQGGTFRTALVVDWIEDQDADYMLDVYRDHPMYDDLWASMDLRTRAADINVPTYHWGGWYDVFTEGPHQAYSGLRDPINPSATPQRLLMGPWTHQDDGAISPVQGELRYPDDSIIPLSDANPITWFQRFLQGIRRNTFDERWSVRFYMMGDVDSASSAGNRWLMAKNWPVPTQKKLLYLQPDLTLDWTAPLETAAPISYLYDPSNPSPTIGGDELSLPAGPRDQSALLSRDDVIAFETDVLTAPVKVVGEVRAVLFVSSDGPDTDFSVRLVDVYPDGRCMSVTDGIAKTRYHLGPLEENFLTPGEIIPLEVSVGSTAIAFDVGHRIQVLVSSSNSRRFEPSRNNDDYLWGDEPGRVALNSLYADNVYVSHLILPEPTGAGLQEPPAERTPSRAAIDRALDRSARGLRLSASDKDAITFEGGRLLIEALTEHVKRR